MRNRLDPRKFYITFFYLRFKWRRGATDDESVVEIEWAIPEDQTPGTYRIIHQGYESSSGNARFYSGTTNSFQVGQFSNLTRSVSLKALNS